MFFYVLQSLLSLSSPPPSPPPIEWRGAARTPTHTPPPPPLPPLPHHNHLPLTPPHPPSPPQTTHKSLYYPQYPPPTPPPRPLSPPPSPPLLNSSRPSHSPHPHTHTIILLSAPIKRNKTTPPLPHITATPPLCLLLNKDEKHRTPPSSAHPPHPHPTLYPSCRPPSMWL